MVDLWVMACLLPFFVYIHTHLKVNPFLQIDFWMCSVFMASVLYVGWNLGKKDQLKICQDN